MHRQRSSNGFTLIELMVVIAIIAILVTIALPAYHDYTIRARVSEALVMATLAKTRISENIANNGGSVTGFDNCVGVDSTPPATRNVATLDCDDATGVVTIVTTLRAGGVTLTFAPRLQSSDSLLVTWGCSSPSSKAGYVPAECR